MFDRFKCNMSNDSLRLDGNDQLRRDLLLARIVARSSGNIPEQQQTRCESAGDLKRLGFWLFLQTRWAARPTDHP